MRAALRCSSLRHPLSAFVLPTPAAAVAMPAQPYAHSLRRAFHAAGALAAAPAAKATPAAAAGGKGAAAVPTGPPPEGSPQWVSEGWAHARLIPEVRAALKTEAEVAADAAELEASRVLPELHAEVRERTGSKMSTHMRRQQLRIPGIVCDRSNPRGNQLLISMDRFELEQLCRKYRRSVNHRVCLLHVAGQSQPIKVIPDEFIRHAVTQDLLTVNWFLFKPRQEKVRVKIPIVYTGGEDCVGVKRGGVLVILRDHVPCVWMGDENVPPFIHIDLTHADGGKVFRNSDLNLPDGLRLFSPTTDYVLATVLGSSAKGREEEPEEEAGKAATPAVQQVSAIQLEKEKKARERKEEDEMVAQKLAQKGKK